MRWMGRYGTIGSWDGTSAALGRMTEWKASSVTVVRLSVWRKCARSFAKVYGIPSSRSTPRMVTAMLQGNPAGIICHQCGQDYARDYWALGSKADPCVCQSCRRDTNPDATDAPRWVPGAHVDEPSPTTVVTPARKRCRGCGGEWVGLIFGPPASKGSP